MGEVRTLFPIIPTRFASVVDALAWYSVGARVALLEPVMAPPVDATGNAFVDAYTGTVFAGLTHQPWAVTRIGHLTMKARENQRHAEHLRLAGEDSAAVEHECIAAILTGWADAFHDAATAVPDGAA